MLVLPLTSTPAPDVAFGTLVAQFGPALFSFGWLFVIMMVSWIAWKTYMLLKMIDYVSAIQWTYLQITLPEDSEETPKSMEIFYDVMGGMHKGPDLVEKYFDGYLEPWYSCEMQFTQGKVRYIMVVPTASRRFFEGVIYGQYPKANIREVEDYTQRYDWRNIRKTFDMYGTDIVLVEDDIYPMKTYREYESTLAEEDRYVDPHQSMIEALTHVGPGEEFWIQVLIRPMDAGDVNAWAEKGQAEIKEISGQASEKPPGFLQQLLGFFTSFPGELLQAITTGPVEAGDDKKENQLRFFNPVDEAKMKGILQKVSQTGYKVKIRAIYLAPVGQIQKPNIGRLIGVFKQFNTFHLNSLKPDSDTKTNGPNYFMRDARRYFREKRQFLNFQWRDMFGIDSGQWMNAEELATLYHFPIKYVRAPSVERAKAGLQGPPDNVPYA